MAKRDENNSEVLAMQAAGRLREAILAGQYAPGAPLREAALADSLEISRNTLREAFRQLVSEGLVDQQLHHGTTVKVLSVEEIKEIYVIRRTLELRGIEESPFASSTRLRSLDNCVERIEQAAKSGHWKEAGTQSLLFHYELVRMIKSERLNRLFNSVCAQLRLAFAPAASEERFQRPWAPRDRALCDLIVAGNTADALRAAENYFRDSERMVLDIHEDHAEQRRQSGTKQYRTRDKPNLL